MEDLWVRVLRRWEAMRLKPVRNSFIDAVLTGTVCLRIARDFNEYSLVECEGAASNTIVASV